MRRRRAAIRVAEIVIIGRGYKAAPASRQAFLDDLPVTGSHSRPQG
jgi:hypothetical protein